VPLALAARRGDTIPEVLMNPQPRKETPRSRRRALLFVVAAVLAGGLAAAGYGVWYLFLQPAGPAAVGGSTLPPLPSVAGGSTAPLASGGIDGTWKVDTSIGSFADFTSSFVGYRVQEKLASIGANVAVGRTPQVSGSMTVAGTKVAAATITADLTALSSDDQRRDGQLVRQGIQSGTYPTATFTLTSPLDLGSVPADGQEISVTATGTLNLHGQTKSVQVPLKARLSGSVIQVTGSLPIVFSDYGIVKPSSFMVLTIADEGTMELQLLFTHA
jgi:polyisoprenoid-binding protein YceI